MTLLFSHNSETLSTGWSSTDLGIKLWLCQRPLQPGGPECSSLGITFQDGWLTFGVRSLSPLVLPLESRWLVCSPRPWLDCKCLFIFLSYPREQLTTAPSWLHSLWNPAGIRQTPWLLSYKGGFMTYNLLPSTPCHLMVYPVTIFIVTWDLAAYSMLITTNATIITSRYSSLVYHLHIYTCQNCWGIWQVWYYHELWTQ